MENYFHYFSEIEEHFQRRRGTILLLSTKDWELIKTWKDAGVPLQAVLRGIDTTFDNYDRRPRRTRKVNGLSFCAQAVMLAAEDMQEAALGTHNPRKKDGSLHPRSVAAFLRSNAAAFEQSSDTLPRTARKVARGIVAALRAVADEIEIQPAPHLEDLERRLTVLEEKILAALLASTPEQELLQVRAEADSAMAPYRSKMQAAQIAQLHKQFVHKRLFERYKLPRLSLFYMSA